MIRVQNLTKAFGDIRAVDGISFTIEEGEIVGFLGPNGAGKTTTIRIVTGLIRATSGTVHLFGVERRGPALGAMARIGAMVEIPRFYPHLTGRGNLRVLGTLSGVEDGGAIDRALDTVRLTEAADEAVRTYSQGMRQRLGIAQALLADPDLVLLDEPTNGLDPSGVREIRRLIADLIFADDEDETLYVVEIKRGALQKEDARQLGAYLDSADSSKTLGKYMRKGYGLRGILAAPDTRIKHTDDDRIEIRLIDMDAVAEELMQRRLKRLRVRKRRRRG